MYKYCKNIHKPITRERGRIMSIQTNQDTIKNVLPDSHGNFPVNKNIPGPERNVLGTMLEFHRKGMIRFYFDAWKKYGDILRIKMGPLNNILLVKPTYIQHVLVKNASNYNKGVSMEKVKLSLGDGLFASEGSLWKRQRSLMQPIFTPRAVNQFAGEMVEDIEKLVNRWEEYAESPAPFDINLEMMRLAMGIIARTMFNMSIDENSMEAARAFAYVLEYVSQQTIRFVDFPAWFPSPAHLRFNKSLQILNDFIYQIIRQRRTQSNTVEKGDLLDLLLQARDPQTGEAMSDRQIRDEVITIFFAGHETTAQALTWTWFLLSQHPEEEKVFHQELDNVLAGKHPELEDIERLEYTRMVIDESMRLYPPILLYARQAIEPDEIDGYLIPAGALITVSQYLTHRHPDYWEDPEAFKPDRFSTEKESVRPRYTYFPFGGGQRICIGNNFALLEMALALSIIGQKYSLRLVPGQDIQPRMVGTLRPNGPVMMTVEKR
jgi:cytochrome P450